MTREEHKRRRGRSSHWINRATRFAIYCRDMFTCVHCLDPFPAYKLTLDHVKPRSEGGSNKHDNLVTARRKCNRARGTKPLNRKVKARIQARIERGIDRSAGREALASYNANFGKVSDVQDQKRVEQVGRQVPSSTVHDGRDPGCADRAV